MTVTTPVETIVDGPTRYNLLMALSNRHLQLFQLETAGRVGRRIDAIRVFDPDSPLGHSFLIDVYDPEARQTETWFYDTQERAGATAPPAKR
ncbi:MAG: hypothetical protein KBC95_01925 [Candidatus Peribacteraceae bacterium]|nr:hypothetical protein [Candidatus Peribacteraceae bacterium]